MELAEVTISVHTIKIFEMPVSAKKKKKTIKLVQSTHTA